MPELPEVETTKTSLNPLIGQTVTKVYTSGKRLRECLPNDLSSLVGYQFTKAVRRAKYLLLYFTHQTDHTKKTLLVHLGMSGSLQQRRVDAEEQRQRQLRRPAQNHPRQPHQQHQRRRPAGQHRIVRRRPGLQPQGFVEQNHLEQFAVHREERQDRKTETTTAGQTRSGAVARLHRRHAGQEPRGLPRR